MTLFRQMSFKTLAGLLVLAQIAFGLQIEAPPEIMEQIFAYSKEAGAENQNVILRASIAKNKECNAFALKLISQSNGKVIKQTERCASAQPNMALQNAVLELFGNNTENGENLLILRIGILAILTAAGLALYCTKPPKPVYGYKINEVEK
jgi:hypothetical protein